MRRYRDPSPTQRHHSVRRGWRAAVSAAVGLAAATALAACSLGGGDTAAPVAVTATATAPVPQGLESFYNQKLSWHPCGKGDSIKEDAGGSFECTSVTVPLDYSAPSGTTITLAVKRMAATKKKIGSLLVNPGGPGGAGLDLVDSAKGYFSDALIASYDVVGFDPRGVGASTAVDCFTDKEMDEERAAKEDGPLGDLSAEQAREAVIKDVTHMRQACEANTKTPGLLDHIDTISAAKDLDILRAVLGDQKLSYLGYSYGTYLGATYAQLFPKNVGRMVLDGALDPSLSSAQLSLGQAKGFEAALRSYVADCQSGNHCPLTGGVDEGVRQIRTLLKRAQTDPIPTQNKERPLTYSLLASAIVAVMYQDESWSVLTEGLSQAMQQNDGSTLLYISDVFASRNSDGTYSGNGDEVINAINCLDFPVQGDEAKWDAEAAELNQASPTFGGEVAYSDLFCKTWGHESTRTREPIRAAGAAPILVVGTTEDPATPYAWSKALASQLESAGLLTWEGRGHTAYGRAGNCVTTAVDNYLLAGEMPKKDLVCKGQE